MRCNFIDKPFVEHSVYYRYSDVNVLVLSESPPPGKKPDFLYNLGHRDRLRKTLAKFFGLSEEELIRRLINRGVLWDMAVRCRPPSRRALAEMARRCSYVTKLVIEKLKPARVVVLGSVAKNQIEEVAKICSYRPREIVHDYHPLYVIRFRRSEACEYFDRLRRWLDV